jgi:hypothetical protein
MKYIKYLTPKPPMHYIGVHVKSESNGNQNQMVSVLNSSSLTTLLLKIKMHGALRIRTPGTGIPSLSFASEERMDDLQDLPLPCGHKSVVICKNTK